MSSIRIADFLFDDANEEKIGRRGISPIRLLQLLDEEYAVVPNRRNRRAAYLLVGRDHGGTFISVPIEPTADPLVWRPITAWFSKDYERRLLI